METINNSATALVGLDCILAASLRYGCAIFYNSHRRVLHSNKGIAASDDSGDA